MKRIILMLTLVVMSLTVFSQYQKYNDLKALYRSYGYVIGLEEEANISQGNTAFSNVTFRNGNEYVIVAMSDDTDVQDIDIYTYYTSGALFLKDDDNSKIAIVSFNCYYSVILQIVIKNYSSLTPRWESKVRYFIAYK